MCFSHFLARKQFIFVTGAAIISKEIFDTFEYNPDPDASTVAHVGEDNSQPSQMMRNTAIEIPLSVFLECLNIFGTAVGTGSNHINSTSVSQRQPAKTGEDSGSGSEESDGDEAGSSGRKRQGKIDSFFARVDGKGTGMRLSYAGAGYPLVMLL